MSSNPILLLPDDVLYKILLYMEQPAYVAVVVCKAFAPLCSASRELFGNESSIWETVLGGYYLNGPRTSSVTAYRARTQRRSSKRLRRTTAKEDVIHAHCVLRDQTEMALQEIAEMAVSKTPKPLSLARMRGVLNNYGPTLNINQRSAIGGTFLVDCCRARCIKESVILACVKELVEKYGASVAVPAIGMTKGKYNTMPALVVASARGMSLVVNYIVEHLLHKSAASLSDMIQTKGEGRFRLFMNSKKSVSGNYTALEFAEKMKEAEVEHGASERQLPSLNRCIRILRDLEDSYGKK